MSVLAGVARKCTAYAGRRGCPRADQGWTMAIKRRNTFRAPHARPTMMGRL
jgi:hypothetical protein